MEERKATFAENLAITWTRDKWIFLAVSCMMVAYHVFIRSYPVGIVLLGTILSYPPFVLTVVALCHYVFPLVGRLYETLKKPFVRP